MIKRTGHESTSVDELTTEQPRNEPAPRSSGHTKLENLFGFLPATSSSVLLVMDENGYLTPLLTATDLLRLCKATWRAEQD